MLFKIGKGISDIKELGLLDTILLIRNNFRATQIKTYSWDSAQVLLVGNKCDMESERVVSSQRGEELARQLGKFVIQYFLLI